VTLETDRHIAKVKERRERYLSERTGGLAIKLEAAEKAFREAARKALTEAAE
jgi:hypothetical protein